MGASLVQSEAAPPGDVPELGQPQENLPAAAFPEAEPSEMPPVTESPPAVEAIAAVGPLPETAGAEMSHPAAIGGSPAKTKTPGSRTRSRAAAPGATDGDGGGSGSGGASAAGWIPAQYQRCPAPAYPVAAKKDHLAGQVLLSVTVDQEGHPTTVILRRSSGYHILDDAAIATVKRWLFKPATQNGRKIDSRVEVPVRFVAR
jgi:protein TonB